jgi:L-seryl-tRNA(Ser) seleniumtransferase
MAENPLRHLPKMDLLLAHPTLAEAERTLSRSALRTAARSCLDDLRVRLKKHPEEAIPSLDELACRVAQRAAQVSRPHLRRVVNATGVVLHTNLGRAPLAEAAAQAAYEAARGYSNLEYDLANSCRGDRCAHLETLLCRLTGAEAAMAVNNNAAAVFLMLTALAQDMEVAISRGELVEIGGGFRVPDMMERSGARLLEVGATNKTRLTDYEHAITHQGARVLLKVHPSNYKMVGFTEETGLEELSRLARKYAVPLFYDLGSGVLSPACLPALSAGPAVASSLAAGCDLVCFSGDKLLGGPQAGIVVGRRDYIETMKRHPMARVLRIDKLSLAALEATLLLYADPAEAKAKIPALTMLGADTKVLEERARSLSGRLETIAMGRFHVEALPVSGQAGGGSLPNLPLPSYAVALTPADGKTELMEALLRSHSVPIVARISHGSVLLDVRTLTEEDMDEIAEALTHE